MKKLAFVLLAATVFVSCKKSDEVTETPLTSPGMTAKIGGTAINYGIPTAEKTASTSGMETVFIYAYDSTGNGIEISFSKQGGISTGTYSVTNGAFIGISDPNDYYETSNTVNVKITAIDATHIVGFFSGTAEDPLGGPGTKTIADGKFYANFQ